MDEKDFEKNQPKNGVIISFILIILILLAGVGYTYLKMSRKPEKIFSELFSKIMNDSDNSKNIKSKKIKVDLGATVNSNNEELKELIEGIKIKSTTEIDFDKKIFNENIKASYLENSVIDVNALVDGNKTYIYSNELFSKYIQIPQESENFDSIFTNNITNLEMLKEDIKQILKDKLKPERLSQEKVEIDGKRTTKSTLRLTTYEYIQCINNILKETYKYDNLEFIKEIIEQLDEIEENDMIGYVDFSIYTQGLKSKVVKFDIAYTETTNQKLIYIEINIETKNKFGIKVLQNEKTTDLEGANEIFTLNLHIEDDNNATVKAKINIDEESSIILKLDIKQETNPIIESRDTSNSININNLTQKDYLELYENIKKNDILYYAILTLMFDNEFTRDNQNEDFYIYEEPENANDLIENQVI